METETKYKVQVLADNSGKWCGDGLTFDLGLEASAYAKDLMSRWMLVTNWRIIDQNEKVIAQLHE